ncbi:hypothetical protein IL306_003217, partial [Fusarium sp. DS 682]
MADPLSVTASVAGILTTTIQGVTLLCNTIDNVRNAPESINGIRLQLQQLKLPLDRLDTEIRGNETGLMLVPEIEGALASCQNACAEFNDSLLHWTRHSSDGKKSFIDNPNLTLARQQGMAKNLADQMMKHWEDTLAKKLVEAQDDRKAVAKFEEETLRSNETEDRDIFLREIARQKGIIDAFEATSKEALKKVVFERTGQRIHNVKATDNSVALTGFVNAEGKEMTIEQDISNITANKSSIAVAGVVNNVDINALYSTRRAQFP